MGQLHAHEPTSASDEEDSRSPSSSSRRLDLYKDLGLNRPRYETLMLALLLSTLTSASEQSTPTVHWDWATLQGMRNAKVRAPIAARALTIVHTCIYEAWTAYDKQALSTQLRGALRRPASEWTNANKERAISYAAYRALTDLFPSDTESVFKPLMRQLGYDPNDNSTDIETPTGIGNVACAAVLEARHHYQSNQLGDIPLVETARMKPNALGPYSDWTGYTPINPPATVPLRFPFVKPINPDHWQPLTYTDSLSNHTCTNGITECQGPDAPCPSWPEGLQRKCEPRP